MWGKIRWFYKWEIKKFPENVKDYGWVYSFEKLLKDWWWYDLKYGVINLIKWFPIIWRDRDWDYCFWIRLNAQKLRSMEKNIRENGNHTRAEIDADNIKKARLAFERLVEDDYLHNAMLWHDKKYGDLDFQSEPCNWDENGSALLYRLKTFRKKNLTEDQKKMERIQYSRLCKHADYMKKQDLEYGLGIINKYLEHWWD